MVAELDRAWEYHRRHAWADACDAFHAIDRVAPLATPDLGGPAPWPKWPLHSTSRAAVPTGS